MEVGNTIMTATCTITTVLRACGLAIILTYAAPAAAHWSIDTELGLSHDNNLGNARNDDRVSDRTVTASVAATQSKYLDEGDSLNWGGRIAAENYVSYSGLNNLALRAAISYRKKLGLGPLAPWWRASWASSGLSYGDHARNGWLHEAEFMAGKRLDERINLTMNYRLEKRTASEQEREVPSISGDAFSQLSQSVGVNASYAHSQDVVLNLGGQLRHGDIVSTSHRYRQVFLFSKAIAEDKALGTDVYAYRLTGNTASINFGMAWFLSADSSINVGLQRILTHANGDNNYVKSKLALTWTGNF